MSKINNSWEKIFDEFDITKNVDVNGYTDITAADIKEFHEPRLMCKVDFREKIPKPFKDNNLSILAIKNGLYRIAPTSPFIDIEVENLKNEPDKIFSLPEGLVSLNADNITSESKALDAAMLSGMLEHIVGEKLCLTIRGREYTTDFSFNLKNQRAKSNVVYDVASVQIEVDGGYESADCILLIEAKMNFENNMNIRQLLYPHVNYFEKYKKPIISYVMFYDIGGKFHFLPFLYDGKICTLDFDNYKLFQLAQNQSDYDINELYKIKIDCRFTDQLTPFPQADDFNKVYAGFLKIIESQSLTKKSVFENYNITSRQYDYYLNALIWMKLVKYDVSDKSIVLTEAGSSLGRISEKERFFQMAKIIFSNPIFNKALHDKVEDISFDMIFENNMNPESTVWPRRKKTVLKWVDYFKSKFHELGD